MEVEISKTPDQMMNGGALEIIIWIDLKYNFVKKKGSK